MENARILPTITLLLALMFTIPSILAQTRGDLIYKLSNKNRLMTFSTGGITSISEEQTTSIDINITCNNCTEYSEIFFDIGDTRVVKISSENVTLTLIENDLYVTSVNITGVFLGITSLDIKIITSDYINLSNRHEIVVARLEKALDKAFNYLLSILIILISFAFGCELDFKSLKGYFKKPIGILVGLFCQYGVVPALATTLAILGGLDKGIALGLLVYACSPGGGAGHVASLALHGDADLSLSMTFSSIVFSFAFMPLWIYAVGQRFTTHAQIPYIGLFMYLLFLFVPAIIGIIIRRIKQAVAEVIIKYLRPIILIGLILTISIGIYVTLYIVTIMEQHGDKLLLSAGSIPICGYIISLLIALITRQPWPCVKTISIETGVQNMNLALVLLRTTLPSPHSEISSVPALIAGFTAAVTLITTIVIYRLYLFIRGRYCTAKNEEEIKEEMTDGAPDDDITAEQQGHQNGDVKTDNNNII